MFEAIAVAAAVSCAGANDRAPADPAGRMRLLERMTFLPVCFPDNLDADELAALIEQFDLRPPAQLGGVDDRWFTDNRVWTGDIGIGFSAQATKASLTYSFPADGVTWGLSAISSTGPNDLNARFTNLFGAGNVDRGRELVRQALASWAYHTGLSYREVSDDGSSADQLTTRVITRGDIRIGGLPFGTSAFLAYNAFPSALGLAGVGGGDMVINTSYFIGSAYNNSLNNYRYFRNTVAHEHGHGTGHIHTTPCNGTKLMEPFIATGFDLLTVDEIRGGTSSYGDRYAGNTSAGAAADLGNLSTPQFRSVYEPMLSINGASGPGGTNADWFKFTIDTTAQITVTVTPVGGNYQNGQQSGGCSPSNPPFVNATQAGNLAVELRNSSGASILFSASSAGAGLPETINAGFLSAGTYTIRVSDIGPNPSANQIVQLYDLSVRQGNIPATPLAFAGIDKRVAANTTCFFMGDIISRAIEPGSSLNASSYDWDLDGDGVIETNDQPQPTRVYVSNGVYPVMLRVTDSNFFYDDHVINVTVFGATTELTTVQPNSGAQGTTVPVTLTGKNLKNVASASEFFVLGGGVTVIGTPVPNAMGTEVTGLSLQIGAGAAPGARSITVTNSDGNDSLPGGFTVLAPGPGSFDLLSPADGAIDQPTNPTLQWSASSGATSYTVEVDDEASFSPPQAYAQVTAALSVALPADTLDEGTQYFWRVTAGNASSTVLASGAPRSFTTGISCCVGNANGDSVVDFNDIVTILGNWLESGSPSTPNNSGDANCDGEVNFDDVVDVLGNWLAPCP